MYQTIKKIVEKFFTQAQLFKYGFNFSPMYRRTTAKIISVSEDLHNVKIKIPIIWKNKNYVGVIFGGSLFAATDPIYMIQLVFILGKKYVVWDKEAYIRFRRPASKNAFAEFVFSPKEIEKIKKDVEEKNEITIIKPLTITDGKETVFCQLEKTIYIANRQFYKEKINKKNKSIIS